MKWRLLDDPETKIDTYKSLSWEFFMFTTFCKCLQRNVCVGMCMWPVLSHTELKSIKTKQYRNLQCARQYMQHVSLLFSLAISHWMLAHYLHSTLFLQLFFWNFSKIDFISLFFPSRERIFVVYTIAKLANFSLSICE